MTREIPSGTVQGDVVSLTLLRIYEFHLRSEDNLSYNRGSKNDASLKEQPLIKTGKNSFLPGDGERLLA